MNRGEKEWHRPKVCSCDITKHARDSRLKREEVKRLFAQINQSDSRTQALASPGKSKSAQHNWTLSKNESMKYP